MCVAPTHFFQLMAIMEKTTTAFWHGEYGQGLLKQNSREETILLYAPALDKTLRVYAQLSHLRVSAC
jgi:hypothetical protein